MATNDPFAEGSPTNTSGNNEAYVPDFMGDFLAEHPYDPPTPDYMDYGQAYNKYMAPREDSYGIMDPQEILNLAGQYGGGGGSSLNITLPEIEKFRFDQTMYDPAYDFRLKQGLEAVDRKMNAGGYLRSGNRAIALQDYAQKYASQEWQNEWERQYGVWSDRLDARTRQSIASIGAQGQVAAANAQAGAMRYGSLLSALTSANRQALDTREQDWGMLTDYVDSYNKSETSDYEVYRTDWGQQFDIDTTQYNRQQNWMNQVGGLAEGANPSSDPNLTSAFVDASTRIGEMSAAERQQAASALGGGDISKGLALLNFLQNTGRTYGGS